MSAGRDADSPQPAVTKTQTDTAAWRSLGLVGCLTAGATALYWPTIQSLVEQWENVANLTYTHGYLVAAICVWLLFRNRSLFGDFTWSPRAAGALVLASFAWLISYRSGIEIFHQLLLPPILWLAVCSAVGRRTAAACTPAFAYFYFAIPVWSFGNDILQYVTVDAVRIMLAIASVPAYVVDNYVHIPSGTFEIAGGCSGLHFFIVALAISALYGELQRDSIRIRVALICLAALLGVVSNWIRVFTIIVAGYLTDMQHSLIRHGHYYFGWEVFAVTMIVFFLIARRMPVSTHAPGGELGRDLVGSGVNGILKIGIPVTLAALAFGPVWAALGSSASHATATAELPVHLPGWQSRPVKDSPAHWKPIFIAADAEDLRDYQGETQTVSAYTAVYVDQRQGKEIVAYTNSIAGAVDTAILSQERVQLASTAYGELTTRETSGQSALVWYRYEVGTHQMISGVGEQLWYGIHSLTGSPRSRVVVLRAGCASDCSDARRALRGFAEALRVAQSREASGLR